MKRLSPRDVMKMFDETLDELYGPIKIADFRYKPSEVLRKLDPVAYKAELLDFVNSLIDENPELDYLNNMRFNIR